MTQFIVRENIRRFKAGRLSRKVRERPRFVVCWRMRGVVSAIFLTVRNDPGRYDDLRIGRVGKQDHGHLHVQPPLTDSHQHLRSQGNRSSGSCPAGALYG